VVILPGYYAGNENFVLKGTGKMAVCESCGKKTTFGRSVPWSKKKTLRQFKPNLQKVTVYEGRKKVRKTLCTRCIRTMVKTAE
jgi:large subunit ribosomal protein L28